MIYFIFTFFRHKKYSSIPPFVPSFLHVTIHNSSSTFFFYSLFFFFFFFAFIMSKRVAAVMNVPASKPSTGGGGGGGGSKFSGWGNKKKAKTDKFVKSDIKKTSGEREALFLSTLMETEVANKEEVENNKAEPIYTYPNLNKLGLVLHGDQEGQRKFEYTYPCVQPDGTIEVKRTLNLLLDDTITQWGLNFHDNHLETSQYKGTKDKYRLGVNLLPKYVEFLNGPLYLRTVQIIFDMLDTFGDPVLLALKKQDETESETFYNKYKAKIDGKEEIYLDSYNAFKNYHRTYAAVKNIVKPIFDLSKEVKIDRDTGLPYPHSLNININEFDNNEMYPHFRIEDATTPVRSLLYNPPTLWTEGLTETQAAERLAKYKLEAAAFVARFQQPSNNKTVSNSTQAASDAPTTTTTDSENQTSPTSSSVPETTENAVVDGADVETASLPDVADADKKAIVESITSLILPKAHLNVCFSLIGQRKPSNNNRYESQIRLKSVELLKQGTKKSTGPFVPFSPFEEMRRKNLLPALPVPVAVPVVVVEEEVVKKEIIIPAVDLPVAETVVSA
jgi:hypothetical protein